MANEGRHSEASSPPGVGTTPTSIEYSVHAEERLVYVRLGKVLKAADVENYATALRHDPQFDPDFSEIADLREVEQVQITPGEAINLADHADPFAMSSRRAFITASDLQVSFARMHQMLRRPSDNLRIFDTLEKAKDWVRSPEPPPAPGKRARILPFIPRWFS